MLSATRASRLLTRRKLGLLIVVGAAVLAVPTFFASPLVAVLAGDEKAKPPASESADKPEPEYLPRPSEAELRILAALESQTTTRFSDTPLEEAVNTLSEQHAVQIWLDRNALQEEGIDPSTPVSLNLQQIRLASALKLVLDPLNITFAIEDDVLKITTKTKEGANPVTRTYPVRDLCPQAQDYKALKEAIEQTVEPQSWQDSAGQGTLVAHEASGSLVISQTRDVHAKVLQLIRTLREAKRKAAK